MIDPRDIEIGGKTYVLSKFPAIAGREVITQYPLSSLPKVGDYKVNEELMLKVMAYVGVRVGEQVIMLNSRALVDNHVPNFEDLMRLEWAMLEYNCSFFQNGKLSGFLETALAKVPDALSQMWTASQAQSSAKGSPRSTS